MSTKESLTTWAAASVAQGTCCRSAVLSTIRSLRLASINAYEASTLAGSILNLSSSTSPTNRGAFKSVQGSDAVESPLALGLRRYLARMSSVVSRIRKGLLQAEIYFTKLDINNLIVFMVYVTLTSVAQTMKY